MKRIVRKVKRIICCLLVGLLLSEKIAAAVYAEESTQSVMEAEAGNEVGVGYETVSGNAAEIENEDEVRNEAGEEIPAEPYAGESRADSGELLIDNLIYRIDSENTVTCVGYKTEPSGAVVIPEKVDDSYKVCGIGDKAFYKCREITSVQLPDTITTIGESAFEDCNALETVNIPSSVTSIGSKAFKMCIKLKCDIIIRGDVTEIKPETFFSCPITAITLPDRLKTIGKDAFGACVRLESISIPETVTDIGESAFMSCSKLVSINIPKGITVIRENTFVGCGFESFDIPEHITTMEFSVFDGCSNLERVSIPESVKSMAGGAFSNCTNLKSIEIPKTIPEVGNITFLNCSNLTELKMWDTTKIGLAPVFKGCEKFATFQIVITKDKPQPLTISRPEISFEGCPADRSLVFLNEDGTELTGEALKAAQDAYRAVNDGNTEDNLWYGWKIGDAPETTYAVEIKVNLDDKPWSDSGKTFCLSKDGGNSYITDLTAVGNGTYDIYEVTGTTGGTRASGYLDTGVDVTVNGGDAEATVDYYTVTFYDGDIPYGADTQQRPQIVLKGEKAVRPATNPDKEGFIFKGWMTAKDGNTLFDFDNTAIAATAGIYASWADNSVTLYQITATANGGGIISPDGTVKVSEGANQTFTITPQEGYKIQEVLVDGKSQGVIDKYTFTNVKENHTISVSFLKKEEPVSDFEITVTAGGGGSISPAGTVHVTTGGSQAFTITPDEGYRIADVLVDGKSQGVIDNYTFTNVKENHTISASFLKKEETGGTEKPGENAGGTGGTDRPGENAGETAETDRPGESESNNGGSGNRGNVGSEPKTGDFSSVEIYATAAMIAGLLYLLLSFAEMKGLTEAKKKEIISSIIGWADDGRKYRRYVALAAIFFVLVYYHSIGKSTMVEAKCVF